MTDHLLLLLPLLGLAFIGARLYRHLVEVDPDALPAPDKRRRAALAAANRWPR